MKATHIPNRIFKWPLVLSALGIWLLFVIGMLFPEKWWGVHGLAFLPRGLSFALLGLTLALILAPLYLKLPASLKNPVKTSLWLPPLLIAFGFAAFFYAFPVVQDVYGDAPRTLASLAKEGSQLFPERYETVLSPNVFNFSSGELTVLNGMEYLIKTKGWDAQNAFRIMGLLFGFGFIALSLLYFFRQVSSNMGRGIIVLLLAGSPFLQNFMGRVEIYAPILFFLALYLICLQEAFKKPSRIWMAATTLALFLALKFHGTSFLLLPSYGLLVLYTLLDEAKKKEWFTWKKLGLLVLGLVFAGGLLLYFVVLEDHKDPRFLSGKVHASERLFLPLFSPEAPLDRYNLLSINHILDYFNNILLWSPPAVFLLVFGGLFLRKRIRWSDPAALVMGITFVLYLAFFFVINPLLGMVMDWDLLSIPGVVLLFWVVKLYQPIFKELPSHLLATLAALALLAMSFFWVNASREALSQRMAVVSTHSFKTYWQRSVDPLRRILELQAQNPQKAAHLVAEAIEEQKPYALSGKDWEFAEANRSLAALYRTTLKDYSAALQYHETAESFNPQNLTNQMGLMEAYYLMGQKPKAFEKALLLAREGYPDEVRSLLFVLDIGLEQGFFEACLPYARRFVELQPEDKRMAFIYKSLQEKSNLDRLSDIFRGK